MRQNTGAGQSVPPYYNFPMADASADGKWPRLLSLSVHEFRTPITVVAGYIRMLLKDRAGPLSDPQRRLLEEAEKSCARLSALVAEMSDLAALEAGTAPLNRGDVDLQALLADTVAALPGVPDQDKRVDLASNGSGDVVSGDAARLKAAFTALMTALRRELVTSDTLYVRQDRRSGDGRDEYWIAFGDREQIDRLQRSDAESLQTFDEWRGGCGLSLAIARRIFDAHGGRVWSAGDGAKTAAMVML